MALVLTHLISAPSGVPGFGSQASPMSSPTSSPVAGLMSLSFWSGSATSGQLSPRFGKPSPSWSVGWFAGGPAVASVGVGSQVSGIPSGYGVPENWSLSPCGGRCGFQTVSGFNGHESSEFSKPSPSASRWLAAYATPGITVPASGSVRTGMPPSLAGVFGLSLVTPYETPTVLSGVQKSVRALGARGVADPDADAVWRTTTLG